MLYILYDKAWSLSVSGVTARGLKPGTALLCNQTNYAHMRTGAVNVLDPKLPLRPECAECDHCVGYMR